MRIIARSVWNLLVFLLNTLIFILIGVQLSGIVARLTDHSVVELFFYGTFVSAVAIFVRFAWVYPATYLPLVLRAMLGEQVAPPRERSEEHTSELQSRLHLVCRLLLEKKKKTHRIMYTNVRSQNTL